MMLMLPGIFIATPFIPHGMHSYNLYLYVILACVANTLFYGFFALLVLLHRSNKSPSITSVVIGIVAIFPLTGCRPATTPTSVSSTQATTYPTRPTVPPPAFKLFHQTDNSLTLVTAESATDEQIESLLWQLHDAARNKSFDKLHLPQKFIDKRDPIVFIHIYRGTQCAAEKYAAGKPPCGGSYHAAGDYTLGSFKDPNRDDGVLLHDEDHQTELWYADASLATLPSHP